MKQIILGTAGHIDHGKTTLIKAVTGTDTDRLKEEKLRGITIELGFASLDLPNGQHIGVVDVPGHEKFVKNMVAGATGIDIVVMVIAADEGVMPQTREHMEICTLLGIRHGFVALTKIDMVDEEWLELVTEDVGDFCRGTFLEDAPIVPVSGVSGKGIPEFIEVLEQLSAEVPQRPPSSLFRLPVDRVFSMKGFGTVITGSLISGRVRVGDTIMIYPSGITSKVRGIQVHNQSVEMAEPGTRTAINFQGLDKSAVTRGEVLAIPGTLTASYMVDVSVHFLSSNKKPAKNRTRVRFHSGTNEILGVLALLDREELAPGDTCAAQLRLDEPVALVKDDRFVIRSYSPVRTIGGGHVLNPIPPKHKMFRKPVIEGLESIDNLSPEDLVAFFVAESGFSGVSFSHLAIMTNIHEKALNTILQNHLSKRALIQIDKDNRIYVHQDSFQMLEKQITATLEAYHLAHPLKAGMLKEELRSKFPQTLGVKVFNQALNQLVKDGGIVQETDSVRLAEHDVSLRVDQTEVREKIIAAYRGGGLSPPYFKELKTTLDISEDQAKDVLMLLVDEGRILKVKEDLFFDAAEVDRLKGRVVDFLVANQEMSTPQFKDIAGVSRKYLIPLIEYFDSKHITIRIGDIRKLRKAQ